MDAQNFTQEQLSGIVGKARTTVRDILTINRLPQAIRDECRGDRTTIRQTLIDIARKKQERGMLSAYKAYR
jgi:ParB family chromosome partitioning protein